MHVEGRQPLQGFAGGLQAAWEGAVTGRGGEQGERDWEGLHSAYGHKKEIERVRLSTRISEAKRRAPGA